MFSNLVTLFFQDKKTGLEGLSFLSWDILINSGNGGIALTRIYFIFEPNGTML